MSYYVTKRCDHCIELIYLGEDILSVVYTFDLLLYVHCKYEIFYKWWVAMSFADGRLLITAMVAIQLQHLAAVKLCSSRSVFKG